MCLHKITKARVSKDEKTGIGYKVFKVNKGKLFGIFEFTTGWLNKLDTSQYKYGIVGKPRPYNKWLNSKDFTTKRNGMHSDNNIKYVKRFHVFATKNDAIDYSTGRYNDNKVVKVKYRNAMTIGKTRTTSGIHPHNTIFPKVIVVKEIMLLKD